MDTPDRSERSIGTSSLAAAGASEIDPMAGLWRRCRTKKLLDALTADPHEVRRQIEIDHIFASRAAWAACAERLEGGWDEIDLDGFVFAERTVG